MDIANLIAHSLCVSRRVELSLCLVFHLSYSLLVVVLFACATIYVVNKVEYIEGQR